MEYVLNTTTIQWAVVVIILLVIALFATQLIANLRNSRVVRIQQKLSIDVLKQDLEYRALKYQLGLRRLENSWAGIRKFSVDRKVLEGGEICSLYLMPHDGKELPSFEPGQYLTFQLHLPGESKPTVRCYSLSDSPHKSDYYRVSIKRQGPPSNMPDAPPGKVSSFVHDNLDVGSIVDIITPRGKFFMDQTHHTPVVLIGGGVGFTPLLSMLNTIIDSGSKREVWFFYGVRNSNEHIMAEHLKRVAKKYENINMQICYSSPLVEDKKDVHYHHSKRVSVELFKEILPSNNYDFYICGPPPMMDSIVNDLKDWGVPETHIHFEAFGPLSKKSKGDTSSAADISDSPSFNVEFSKSGKSLLWNPSSGSIMDLAEENGIVMESGCLSGSCGVCMTAIRDGDVGYLTQADTDLESGSCFPCIAIPKSPLTLDA